MGAEGLKRLADANVAVFGIGGVGGYAAEALARAAVGGIILVDCDVAEPTNLNRQLIALRSTLGRPKVEIMESRIKDINPGCSLSAVKVLATEENISPLLEGVTYAVDAVDDIKAKIAIVSQCNAAGIPVVSAMGAGNRLKGIFRIMDLYETTGDPLAKIMRRELKKRGIKRLKVSCCDMEATFKQSSGEPVQSISYMPGLCGLTLAGEVIRDIIGVKND